MKIEIPNNVAEGIMKYQKCSSKKDSSSNLLSSILQIECEQATVLIVYHLFDLYLSILKKLPFIYY
jgi:hypothetical protein